MSGDDFSHIAAILVMAAVIGAIAMKLRQPLITAFILVGVVVGPVGLGWVSGTDSIVLLSELGIAILLFLVGLKLDFHLVRSIGPVAAVAGLVQMAFTAAFGFLLAVGLGVEPVAAIYVALALAFSSTIIVVKLLSDRHELEDLHGRVAVGLLIVQDIVVIVVLIALRAFGRTDPDHPAVEAAVVIGAGVAMLVLVALITRFLLPRLLNELARSAELLVLAAVAWAVALAALGDWLGISAEVGAFLAGAALASTPYREAIGSRLTALRDFLLLFFFIDLGSKLDFTGATSQIGRAVVLSVFVLLAKPFIIMVVMGAMGYRSKVSFKTGITLAQISEFSLILVAVGLSLGHVGGNIVALVTSVGIITIGVSTYLILYAGKLYKRLAPILRVFERRNPSGQPSQEDPGGIDVILFGLGRYGGNVANQLHESGLAVLAIDHDPRALAHWENRGVDTLYGGADDAEFVASLPLSSARWVVSTIAQSDTNLALLHGLRAEGFEGRIALTAHDAHDAELLHEREVDAVLTPFSDAVGRVVRLVGMPPPGKHAP